MATDGNQGKEARKHQVESVSRQLSAIREKTEPATCISMRLAVA